MRLSTHPFKSKALYRGNAPPVLFLVTINLEVIEMKFVSIDEDKMSDFLDK